MGTDNEVLFANAGRAFLKIFGAALIVVLIGVTQQKTLHGAVAFGIAGLAAAIGSGIAALVTFVPALSIQKYIPGVPGYLADAFIHGFLPFFFTATAGILAEPNYSTWHSAIIAAVVGALNAGFRAVQGWLTPAEAPKVGIGYKAAEPPPVL